MRYRFLLLGLTLAAFIVIKVIDYVVPWPTLMFLLCVALAVMITHSLWMLWAQTRWQRQLRRNGGEILISDDQAKSWQPVVDILIPAKNESRVIETTVRRFFTIDYPNFNVWVIDDASTDNTADILRNLQKEFPRLHIVSRVPGSRPGKSAGLNDALALCRGEVIAVFDADAYVEPEFLQTILPVLAPEGVGAVQAQKKFYPHQTQLLVKCQASEYATDTYFQMSRDLIGGTVELRGNGQLVKRAALIDCGGWNNNTITDDLDLSMRLLVNKWDIRFCPHAVVYEEGVPTWKALVKQRRRWAEGSIRRYLDYIFPINSPTRLSFIERIDTMAFFSLFGVPALVFLEGLSQLVALLTGQPFYPRFFFAVLAVVLAISATNFFIAMRFYQDKMSVPETMLQTCMSMVYVFSLWMPVVFGSFLRILLTQHASQWHRTEHVGTHS